MREKYRILSLLILNIILITIVIGILNMNTMNRCCKEVQPVGEVSFEENTQKIDNDKYNVSVTVITKGTTDYIFVDTIDKENITTYLKSRYRLNQKINDGNFSNKRSPVILNSLGETTTISGLSKNDKIQVYGIIEENNSIKSTKLNYYNIGQ